MRVRSLTPDSSGSLKPRPISPEVSDQIKCGGAADFSGFEVDAIRDSPLSGGVETN